MIDTMNLAERWLSQLASQHYSPASLRSYRQALQPFGQYLDEQALSLEVLRYADISTYITTRLERDNLAKSSVQQNLSILRQFFAWLVAEAILPHNPTTAVRLKRQQRPLPELLDSDLLSQLLDQLPPSDTKQAQLWTRDKAMFELLYGSGLRVSEVVGLNLSDVDKAERLVRLVGKGEKTRIVPIGSKAWQAISDYLPYRTLWLKADESAIFISERHGSRLTTRTVQSRLKHHAKRAGIAQNLYPHLLRHCFASHLLSDSGDLRGVQELLGHSDISTTQIYTHLDFGQLTKVYDKAHPRAKR
ncbi:MULTISPECIES: site-specific tyrosine recombinase/integron integrase [unclassified Moraxella]|uniref:site-specific tyrosine recombinase/integron integrase n=1 Tax=unclassified Moraxella TaxID=2685852 RepID=UPI003AF67DBB